MNKHKYEVRHNCTFRTWALTVARNHCLDFVKKQQSIAKRTVSFDALPPHKAENIVRQEFVDYLEEEQEQKICEEENLNNLNGMLDLLSEKDRKIVLLRYEHGSKKAAEMLNLTDSNVRKISSRAMITFRNKMLENK
jgi:RNA polymerase sigma factor (sigma-70 family)